MVTRHYEGHGSTDCDLRGALVGAGLQPDHPVPPLPDLLLGEVPLVLRGKPRLVVSTKFHGSFHNIWIVEKAF